MWEPKRILVPLDGSALAEQALPVAQSLAKAYGAEVILLRVLDVAVPAELVTYPEAHWVREALQANHREVQRYLAEKQIALDQAGVDVRVQVFDTSPAEEIMFAARNEAIDLIVMSSHGRGGDTRWTAGSVADKVMQHSPCPVLLIRKQNE
jgi:nucleotide-binding universal stress UspA family protein